MNLYKSMGPDYMHPRVLIELANMVAESLSIIHEKLWLPIEDLCDWKKGNTTPIYRKVRKEGPGNYKPVSLLCLGRSWNRYSWKRCLGT